MMTVRDAELVRGGSEEDVARLLRSGGCLLWRGSTLHVREGDLVLQAPYALISFGSEQRRILVLLLPDDASEERRGRRVVHHLP